MTNKLEPCPLCGGEVERYNYMPGYVGGHGFLCKECGAQFLTGSDDDEATELFNTRYKRTCKPSIRERHIKVEDEEFSFFQAICDCGNIVGEGDTPNLSELAERNNLDKFCSECGAEVLDD